jgi:GT2 family glycosyltransferase
MGGRPEALGGGQVGDAVRDPDQRVDADPDITAAAAGSAVSGPALHGVLVTYRRPGDLTTMFQGLAAQDRRLDTLVVVDNDPDASAREAVAALADEARRAGGPDVSYVSTRENLGPAGGIAVGMRHVLTYAADDDWLVSLDDDDPPRTRSALADLTRFATGLRAADPRVGGVGAVGTRFDTRRARGVRIPDAQLAGPVPVDWIGGNNLPLYSVAALRDVGVFEERLFFGFDDLEFGLRLGAAGYTMFAHGDLWHAEREAHGRLGSGTLPERGLGEPTWRRYYSLRNLLFILHARGDRAGQARLVARSLAKPVYNLPRGPRLAARHLGLNARAILDAYRGRMGLTVPPTGKS